MVDTIDLDNTREILRQHCDQAPVYQPPAKQPALPIEWFGSAALQTDMRDFVEGLLTDGGMSVVYGESNSGKTFFAFDLAIRVALGWDWQGRETEPGGVLYLACEGGYGVQNREIAFREEHGITGSVPFASVRASVDLRDPDGDTENVIAAAEHVSDTTGRPIKLIVVDTLARAMAGGEENSSQDMGRLVRQVDTIRQATGAHVMLIHHSGKDAVKGARGHSSLRAATDTEIEISRPEGGDVATALVRKQRDLPGGDWFSFELKQVALGTDRRGNPITSCVVQPAESPGRVQTGAKLSDEQKLFLDEVRNLVAKQGEKVKPVSDMAMVTATGRNHLRNHLVEAGFLDSATAPNSQRATVSKYLNKLKAKGLLGITKDYVWLVDETATTATTPQPPATGCAQGHRNHRNHPPLGGLRGCAPDDPAETDIGEGEP